MGEGGRKAEGPRPERLARGITDIGAMQQQQRDVRFSPSPKPSSGFGREREKDQLTAAPSYPRGVRIKKFLRPK